MMVGMTERKRQTREMVQRYNQMGPGEQVDLVAWVKGELKKAPRCPGEMACYGTWQWQSLSWQIKLGEYVPSLSHQYTLTKSLQRAACLQPHDRHLTRPDCLSSRLQDEACFKNPITSLCLTFGVDIQKSSDSAHLMNLISKKIR